MSLSLKKAPFAPDKFNDSPSSLINSHQIKISFPVFLSKKSLSVMFSDFSHVGDFSPRTKSIALIILLFPELFFPTIIFFPFPNFK